MTPEQVSQAIDDLPDEVLEGLQFSAPWQYDPSDGDNVGADPDGFTLSSDDKDDSSSVRQALQAECWRKFNRTPYINTAVRGQMGRLTGLGFETTSGIYEIMKVVQEIEEDQRNRLYNYWPKYVARANVEGELFLVLTLHPDGFIEVDFLDPSNISGGSDDSGIIWHPTKTLMPLFYLIDNGTEKVQIPSIFMARYPELLKTISKDKDYDRSLQSGSRSRKSKFKQFNGYNQFVVSWDRGFVTKRAVSYLRTTLEWLNHYENLKKYEVDHKKSSGSYLWVFTIEDTKAFRLWNAMTAEQRASTGIAAKKTPGATLVVPPGMKLECVNPQLSPLRDEDTDIKELVAAGINEPTDIMTGTSKGTFASVKETRGPMSDRTSDEVAYFERYLRFDFWSNIFFLKSKVSNFPEYFEVDDCVGFDKKQEPIIKKVKEKPEKLLEFSFPVSETIDLEGKTKALFGVKHGPLNKVLGVDNKKIAKIVGIGGWSRTRQIKALEDKLYPELEFESDAESIQEKTLEKPKAANDPKTKAKPKPVKEPKK